MKTNIILAALVALLSLAGVSTAQSLRLTFPEAIVNYLETTAPVSTFGNWGQGKTVKIDFCKSDIGRTESLITYTGLEDPGSQLFEAVLPASSPEACLANRDFSSGVPVGPERAILVHDRATNSGSLRWFFGKNDSSNCRVLLVRNSVGTTDLATWRTNFGTSGYASDEEAGKSDSDQSNAATPQRSRVTSLTVTFSTLSF